ncbi:hypothetical protein [Gimesia algae]|uniref:Uncharacterized protein n=1 Tax=Gimesia algae TaxID=2527971 RepID=A0A517VFJ8_9PLAN|nr:hypothetical protein [Gimesia algae]QDT91727.1 hypothetical protein Pan161_33900 [Gimesia algae]
MTQTEEQDICEFDGENVTIKLPSTILSLTREEADTLFCNLEVDLLHGQFNEMYGKEVSETVIVVDVSIAREEAWGLYRSLENIVDPDDEPIVDDIDWIEAEDSFCQRVHWLEEGF